MQCAGCSGRRLGSCYTASTVHTFGCIGGAMADRSLGPKQAAWRLLARRLHEAGRAGCSLRLCAHPASCPDPEDCIGKPGECDLYTHMQTDAVDPALDVRRPVPEKDRLVVEEPAAFDPYGYSEYPHARGLDDAAILRQVEATIRDLSWNRSRNGRTMGVS
jgi:hypothetical protein